jgi:hypothetical protein
MRFEQRGDVLEISIAARLSLQPNQVVEADRPDSDALDHRFDRPQSHLRVGASTGNLTRVEEVELAGGRAQGEVAAVEEVIGVANIDVQRQTNSGPNSSSTKKRAAGSSRSP